MSGGQKAVEVYVDRDGTGGPAHMGTLHAQSSGREEVFSFAYALQWLVMLRLRVGLTGCMG